ncbi:MAG: glycosyl transferase [Bacteroidia bacterium]|nr:glycosyl transferase [Bacteroidia bacterium]
MAKGDLIITTDGDCRMSDKWLSALITFYEAFKPKMIIGPVGFYNEKSIFEKIQSLEFLSLIGAGAGSAGIGHPVLCNGANLAFEKKIYIKFNNALNMDYASGDDVFLLHNLKKEYPENILFLKSADAIVFTKPQSNLYTLIQQRIRWSSKSKGFKDSDSIITAGIVWLMNISLLTVLILTFFNPVFLKLFLLLFILKSLADFLLLWKTTAFFNKQNLLFWFLPLQLVYFFYVSLIGIFGCFVKSKWKGRKI